MFVCLVGLFLIVFFALLHLHCLSLLVSFANFCLLARARIPLGACLFSHAHVQHTKQLNRITISRSEPSYCLLSKDCYEFGGFKPDLGSKVRVTSQNSELQTKSQSCSLADPQNPNRTAQKRNPNGV